MSDERLPSLDPAGDGKWLVRAGDPRDASSEPLGEVAERTDGTFLARRATGSERIVETRDQALQYVVEGFASL